MNGQRRMDTRLLDSGVGQPEVVSQSGITSGLPVTPSKIVVEVPDFHPYGWVADPCVTRELIKPMALHFFVSVRSSHLDT